MKNPHPSGRPVNRGTKKPRVWWGYPTGSYATTRLKSNVPTSGYLPDAIGYLRSPVHDGLAPDECRRIGFVDFDQK